MKLVADNVNVCLGDQPVLRQVSLSAHEGEFIALLGPNGAGKSTLLRTISGLLDYQGSITISGRDLRALSARDRAKTIAFLPQTPVVHWPLSGREIVSIGRLPYCSSLTSLGADDTHAIERALKQTDATGFADRPVTKLSGGERARILLARALAVESPMLLADEPLATLDPQHQLTTLSMLRDCAADNRLVIAALHDLSLAARYATRIVLLKQGIVVADGPPATVMTPDLLKRVFAIDTISFEYQNSVIPLPWQAASKP